MWRTNSGAGRRGYQPFGSAYGFPYGSSYGAPANRPSSRPASRPANRPASRPASRSPYGNPGNPYGYPSAQPSKNSRQNAKKDPVYGWPFFEDDSNYTDRADVSTMKGFKKTSAPSAPKNDDLKETADETTDTAKDTSDETGAQDKSAASSGKANATGATGATGAASSVTSEADEKSPEDRIIEEAEAVIDDAVKNGEAAADAGLEAAKKEAADWQDRYMRLHAEWDTYRRRMTEQRAEEKTRATEKLMEDLLPVLDDFERTVDYANENGEKGLLDGVKAVQSKLIDALKKDGLEVIDPLNEPYDALEAQAVATVPDEDAYDETVKDVYQKGYKLGNKVIRPAMVTVTTGGPARPKDEDGDASDE